MSPALSGHHQSFVRTSPSTVQEQKLRIYRRRRQVSLTCSVCLFFSPTGFQLKHFLQDNETLSSFLLTNASFPEKSVRQIREANINLEKVRRCVLHMLSAKQQIKSSMETSTNDLDS